VIWVVDELKKPPHCHLHLRLASRLTDAQSDTLARLHMTPRLLRKVVSRSDNENAGQCESPSIVASETELAARPIVKVRTARIVVSSWRAPIRSIGGALTKSRHGVAVLAEVRAMSISLWGVCHRTKRNCRRLREERRFRSSSTPSLSSACFQLRVNGSMRTRFRPTGLQLVKTLT
jgi:hypothetical protein